MAQETEGKPSMQSECCAALDEFLSPSFFKAFCDPNRSGIFSRLAATGRPITVGEIAEQCTTDVSVVSRHLAVLREAGVIEADRQGRQVYYRVRYGEVVKQLRTLADAIEACCGDQE